MNPSDVLGVSVLGTKNITKPFIHPKCYVETEVTFPKDCFGSSCHSTLDGPFLNARLFSSGLSRAKTARSDTWGNSPLRVENGSLRRGKDLLRLMPNGLFSGTPNMAESGSFQKAR